jgi:hypothetical protein
MPRLSKIGAAALAAFGWTLGASSVSASYLQVAGGGAGGGSVNSAGQGGGGAGGYLTGTTSLSLTTSYTVIVGAGGASTKTIGAQGGNSQFGTLTASVGGGGGGDNQYNSGNGGSGGSGGGAAYASSTGGTATSGQGNNGGAGNSASPYPGGGGGGAGAAGANGSGSQGGNGGVGLASSISGSSTYYAGGGGGGTRSGGSAGTGGNGGGGQGANTNDNNGQNATQSTGGGGGGSSQAGATVYGGAGGSGVVIISYAGAQQFSGGVVTSVGGNTIHTFTTSGTLGPITTLSASYLIVAGGGGAGWAGGGAGGLLSGSGITIDPNSTYLVTVGAGGTGSIASAANTYATSGGNSAFSMVATTAVGGGGAPAYPQNSTTRNGQSGGSGSGAARYGGDGTGGAGTSGQGFAGGNGAEAASYYGCGGGGGAGAVGSAGTGSAGGAGGVGVASSISGTSTYYAGGGGGAAQSGGTQGAGGNGGGGSAGATGGTSGTANLGGGGGGTSSTNNSYYGGNGGSGVVIISYAGTTQQMAGGTVTIVGGNVIHTFTSTGYLAPLKFSTGSLRFRQSNSGYLSRTPTVAGNRNTWTWSAWVKRGRLTYGSAQMFASRPSASPYALIYFGSDDTFQYDDTGSLYFKTNAVFRDPAAWYHLVITIDTTQATNTNRIKVYVNGVQQTFASSTYPSQNYSTQINTATQHDLGSALPQTAEYFDGEMTEVNFIDGQALAPTSFGTFNSYGVWQPITYGGSYGTNGFYLPFNRQAVSYAGSFNGTNQRLTTPAMTSLTGDFTVEFYCDNTGFGSGDSTVIANYPATTTASESLIIQRQGSGLWGVYCGSLTGSGNLNWSAPTTSVGAWVHIALVRSGTTVTAYYNGVSVATATVSTTITLPSGTSIGAYTSSVNFFLGYISNLRITNTAVYTGNFIPPTSALTAITGTILLTLQNSSIVDNSTNAYSITNVNGVSTGQTYPFSYGIFKDQGPAGNNWTPNNISGAFGSTLDYLGDAPTLTSATVANYCVLSPLALSNGTLSDGGLTWSPSGNNASVWSSFAVNTGKWYFEMTKGSSGDAFISISQTPKFNGYQTDSDTVSVSLYMYYTSGGTSTNRFQYNSSPTAFPSGFGNDDTGTVYGITLDFDTKVITVYRNNDGTTKATFTMPAALYAAPLFVGYSVTTTWPSGQFYWNFGQQPFTYTPPSGFVALNTFNL